MPSGACACSFADVVAAQRNDAVASKAEQKRKNTSSNVFTILIDSNYLNIEAIQGSCTFESLPMWKALKSTWTYHYSQDLVISVPLFNYKI